MRFGLPGVRRRKKLTVKCAAVRPRAGSMSRTGPRRMAQLIILTTATAPDFTAVLAALASFERIITAAHSLSLAILFTIRFIILTFRRRSRSRIEPLRFRTAG